MDGLVPTKLKPPVKFVATQVLGALPRPARRRFKEYWGMRFWRGLIGPIRDNPAELARERAHYAYFYTTHFGLSETDYAGKAVLDIGCGPMGSLEWATMVRERVGLDPLADAYRRLHQAGPGPYRADAIGAALAAVGAALGQPATGLREAGE